MSCFHDLIGQEQALSELRADLARGRLNHAYLFEGRHGTGRYTLARALARRLLCQEPGADSCGACHACKLFAQQTHPDYLEVPREAPRLRIGRFVERRHEANKEDVDHPPVLEFLHLRPALAARRVCLIPDAERMQAEAANAFLKTLEEPPGGSIVLLTTAARDRLPATVVSRCRRVAVAPLPEARITEVLCARNAVDTHDAATLAAMAEGSLGAALALSEEEALARWHWLEDALGELTPVGAVRLGEGMRDALHDAGNAQEKRERAADLLDLLALQLRRRLRRGGAATALARALGALWQSGEQLAANVRPELVLHTAALETVAALRRAAR